MSGDCFVLGGFDGWEVFLVDEFVTSLVYGLCGCCCWLGSFMCSWDACVVSVVARVDRANASLGRGRGLSPVCSFACIAVAFSI